MQMLIHAVTVMTERKRKRRTLLLDSLVLEALKRLARSEGRSENQYVELLLFKIAKERGLITPDTEPLGETRGGERSPQSDEDEE